MAWAVGGSPAEPEALSSGMQPTPSKSEGTLPSPTLQAHPGVSHWPNLTGSQRSGRAFHRVSLPELRDSLRDELKVLSTKEV